jgi:hypothetical protein
LPITLVGVAALLGVGRAVVHRRQAQTSDVEAGDGAPPPNTQSAVEETRPPRDTEAAAPGYRAAPAAVAATGVAAKAADPSAKTAPTSAISARSAAAPTPARRPADRVTLGSGNALLPTEARSRVQLYAKPGWGSR